MARENSFHEYVMSEVFQGIDGITSRPMFGGFGIYKNGLGFALMGGGELYFKVAKNNQADYERLGSKPFVYTGRKSKSYTMSYWLLPEEIMEDAKDLEKWIDKSVEAKMESKK